RAAVTLVVAGELRDSATRRAMSRVVEVAAEARPPPDGGAPAKLWALRQTLIEPYPGEVTQQRPIRRALAPVVAAHLHAADVVVVQFAGLAGLRPRRPAQPWLLDLHNLLSGMAAQELAIAQAARVRWFLRREIAKARR